MLITNHVHLLLSSDRAEAGGTLMKSLGQRYIVLNPVRANMGAHPAEDQWFSYRANAQGEGDVLVQAHLRYASWGNDAASWQAAYRELFWYELGLGLVDEIRRATNGNFALGSERVAAEVAVPGQSERSRKSMLTESGELT
jgi:putative transposase